MEEQLTREGTLSIILYIFSTQFGVWLSTEYVYSPVIWGFPPPTNNIETDGAAKARLVLVSQFKLIYAYLIIIFSKSLAVLVEILFPTLLVRLHFPMRSNTPTMED